MQTKREHEEELLYLEEAAIASQRSRELQNMKAQMAERRS